MALNEVSFAVDEGEMLALVGASGSGKSTLLRNINGLQIADKGIVKIFNTPLQDKGNSYSQIRRLRSQIGFIPQVIPLWTSFTLYRFESNVRAASVLGIVGAGGIGVSLYQSFQSFDYGKVCAILIILILATSIIDTISAKLRNWLV
ncbi:MAG: ATP-binding cassette domain-containing protein [Xenococcaceae cyanobacterium MO_234.B1]|nr:ATP-binding cassette domain-containing protein [Xenococcaceae cyanobacterium MO_234.B1]